MKRALLSLQRSFHKQLMEVRWRRRSPMTQWLPSRIELLFIMLMFSCLCPLATRGKPIADCCCDADTVDRANDQLLWSRLHELRPTLFFRTFKVNLHSPCPFWQDDHQCALRGCAVCGECQPDEIPDLWKRQDLSASTAASSSSASPLTFSSQPSSSFRAFPSSVAPYAASKPSADDELPATSKLTAGIFSGGSAPLIAAQGVVQGSLGADFREWQDDDECMWITQDSSTPESPISYINLALNPESFTGYGGDSAHEIWRAIYSENCFQDGDLAALCYEQRVFYRLLSGMHAAISAHIANVYPRSETQDPHLDLAEHPEMFAPNIEVFQDKLGNHQERLENLYFAFVFMLRAVNKATPVLLSYDYATDGSNSAEDAFVHGAMQQLLTTGVIPECHASASFDESLMFKESNRLPLKAQFRSHFRNLSLIMDCVGCDKCRLHGKLQILGLGTALKILFNERPFQLQRNEVMALINTLAKFSNALKIVHEMERAIVHQSRMQRIVLTAFGLIIATAVAQMLKPWLSARLAVRASTTLPPPPPRAATVTQLDERKDESKAPAAAVSQGTKRQANGHGRNNGIISD